MHYGQRRGGRAGRISILDLSPASVCPTFHPVMNTVMMMVMVMVMATMMMTFIIILDLLSSEKVDVMTQVSDGNFRLADSQGEVSLVNASLKCLSSKSRRGRFFVVFKL